LHRQPLGATKTANNPEGRFVDNGMVGDPEDLGREAWIDVLDNLREAVIVFDRQRSLLHVNDAARRLLGYEQGQEFGGRCKLTTRGTDCDNACPLTFALNNDLDRVDDFATVYHAADGRAVPLKITVIPFTDEAGEFCGAAEILRPTEPSPGFFLAGNSQPVEALRERVVALARSRADVCLVGELPACRDVARALHRFSGLPENLFRTWSGCWDDINPWPPGTLFAFGSAADGPVSEDRPEGWRIVVACNDALGNSSFEILELPSVKEIDTGLSAMIVSWIRDLAPRTRVSHAALERLERLLRDCGFEELERILAAALPMVDDCLEADDLPIDGYHTAFVDELLQSPKPLAALEERLLREVLERCGWKMQEAADRVGISRVTLWRKMKDLGIDRP
jgi:transcriptional regulator with PAS, ATPase and Fis domain